MAFDGKNYTKAVWAGLPGQLEAIIKENDTITGFPANIFFSDISSSSSFLINRSGAVAFLAELKGASTGTTALVHFNGVTQGILKTGDQAPGFPSGTVAGGVTPIAISDAGLVLAGMTTGGAALWFWDFEKIERIPASLGDCLYFSLAAYAPGLVSINQTGSVVFNAALTGGDENSCSSGGVFKWSNGNTELIVKDGDLVPGMPEALFGVSLAESPPKINDQDEIIFNAKLIQTASIFNNSVWVKSDQNEPRLLIMSGEGLQDKPDHIIFSPLPIPVPILDINFANSGYSMLPATANGLDILLAGKPRETQPYANPRETGVSQLATIASKNDQPPGFESSWFYASFSSRALNNAEQYVFAGFASNALENRSTSAIWRGNGGGLPRLVAQNEMKLSANSVEHTLKQIYFPVTTETNSTAGGKPSWFSDNGEIVFLGLLDNSSNSAILLITDDSKEQKIFSLAEQLFPQFFSPANRDNQLLEGFTYRYYPTTNTYIGIKNGEVFVLGDVFGLGPQRIDTIENTLRFLEERVTTGS
ncbi:MAG: hypothetical protein E6Q62_04700 [Nitrosomonas sp.]|nr:MAG: hypothetical protein E6Q62_04700 [Nitrosomonas sp.]